MNRYDPRNGRRKTRLTREKRTIPVVGYSNDTDKYFECWYCGWVCNIERDGHGKAEHGAVATKPGKDMKPTGLFGGTGKAPIPDPARPYSLLLYNDRSKDSPLFRAKGDGTTKQQINSTYIFSSVGCPGCGTYTWHD